MVFIKLLSPSNWICIIFHFGPFHLICIIFVFWIMAYHFLLILFIHFNFLNFIHIIYSLFFYCIIHLENFLRCNFISKFNGLCFQNPFACFPHPKVHKIFTSRARKKEKGVIRGYKSSLEWKYEVPCHFLVHKKLPIQSHHAWILKHQVHSIISSILC